MRLTKLRQAIYQDIVHRFLDCSIRTKLITLFLLITFIPIGIVAYLNYLMTREALTKSANQALFAAASKTATQIDSFMSSTLSIIQHAARLPDIEEFCALPPQQREYSNLKSRVLQTLFALKDFYMFSFAILDSSGKNILDILPANSGKDESDRLYFQLTLNTRQPSVSPIEFPSERGSVALHFSSPIARNSTGSLLEITGILRMSYNVAILQKMLAQSKGLAGSLSHAILFNEHSLMLANSAFPELLFRTVAQIDSARAAELQAVRVMPDRPVHECYLALPSLEYGLKYRAKHPFFAAYTHPDKRQLQQIAAVELSTVPWIVTFVQPQQEFLAPVHVQISAVYIMLGVMVVSVLVIALGTAHFLSAPITRLTSVVENMGAGDLQVRVPLSAHDEIGKLGRTFNSMAAQLRQTLEDLKQHRDRFEELVKQRTAELEQEIVERKQAEKLAKAANAAKNYFLSNVSHELRTPLNAILGYAQLLRYEQDLSEEKLHEAVATIHRSGEHLLRLIGDVLDLSKIEAGRIELTFEEFPLPQFLRNFVENTRIQASKKNIPLVADIPSDLPAVVYGDEVRLRQILGNLLNNAIKFTSTGRITLRISDLV